MTETLTDPPREVLIRGTRHDDYWEVEVSFDGTWVGGGTGPDPFVLTDTAGDILFGDTNDMLNGYHGALGQIIEDQQAAARTKEEA